MSGSLSHAANAEPNMTPILDMVFQLITFFMLVINFKVNEIDRQMALPIVSSAKKADYKMERLLMLNVNLKGEYTVWNRPQTKEQMKNYIDGEAASAVKAWVRSHPDYKDGDDLDNVIVIVRADRGTPFSKLSYLLKLCQDSGMRRFAFRAMNKAAS